MKKNLSLQNGTFGIHINSNGNYTLTIDSKGSKASIEVSPTDLVKVLSHLSAATTTEVLKRYKAINTRLVHYLPIVERGDSEIVFIGLHDEDIPLMTVENVVNACGEFMEELGFELKSQDEPVYGSFFQWLGFELKSEKNRDEVKDIYSKGKSALQARYLNTPLADNTEKYANAASKMLDSLKDINKACLRLGGILIIKTVQDSGEPIVIIDTISPRLSETLDDNPELLKDPDLVLESYNTLKRLERIKNHSTNVDEVDIIAP